MHDAPDLSDILICPDCRGDLRHISAHDLDFACTRCHREFIAQHDRIIDLLPTAMRNRPEGRKELDSIIQSVSPAERAKYIVLYEKAFHDDQASTYDSLFTDPWPIRCYCKQVIEMQVYEYVKDAPFILDLCCGTGKSSIPLIALGKRVIGVDVSTAMLKVYADKCLAKGFSDFVLLAADASAPPLRTGVCKAITLIGGLHHIPEPARCLPYLTGLLSPGGVIIVHEPLHLGVSTKLSKVLINLCALIDVPRVRRALSRRLLRQEVEPLVSEEEELIHTPYERSFSSPEELTSLLDGQVKILALRPQALLSFRLPSDTRPTLAALAVGFDNWLAKKGLTRWSDCEAIFVVASKLSDGQRNYESGR